MVENVDFEPFNKQAHKFAKTKTNHELAVLAKEMRERILITIQEQPEDKFTREYKDGQGNPFIVKDYLNDFIWHDQHHMKQIGD